MSFHWIALSIFTGGYLVTATTIPLFVERPGYTWAPLALVLTVSLICLALFYVQYGLPAMSPVTTAWIAFVTRSGLALTILGFQLWSLTDIRDKIWQISDLAVNLKVYWENFIIFVAFAVITILESGVALANVTAGGNTNSDLETGFFSFCWCVSSVLYVMAYLAYANILQSVWCFERPHSFECPVLGSNVPLAVYIRNRQLIRHKQKYNVRKDDGDLSFQSI